jgi:ectoine hydroxylase-related dioxygenase (phytanoyl-CoA dioxygenase family)
MAGMEYGAFTESNDLLGRPDEVRRRFKAQGYLFFRGLFPREKVLALRGAILGICRESGWIKDGTNLDDAITDHAPVMEGEDAWKPIYARIQKLEAFHRLPHEPAVAAVMEACFEEPVFRHPCTIGRVAFPDNERATPAHQDYLYIQGSIDTISCWVPIGDTPAAVGGLILQPESHKAGFKVPKKHPGVGGNVIATDSALPWLGTDFRAGDALLFHSLTVHAARPTTAPDRLRLSMDFRYSGLTHAVAEGNLLPHYAWLGSPFTWDELDADWDPSFRRYWERGPKLKVQPHESRLFAKE